MRLGARFNEANAGYWVVLASLLLSVIAEFSNPIIGRDAAFYVDTAQAFQRGGLAVALEQFNWPWFSILLAFSNQLIDLPIEWWGRLWCALFMAGTCAFSVDLIARRVPGSAIWASLVVLALPAFNGFRGEILREHGFWFFSVLALWLAMRWSDRGGWRNALLVNLAVVAAALFRLEAVLLLPAVALASLRWGNLRENARRLAQLAWLPALLLVGVLTLVLSEQENVRRVRFFVEMLDPRSLIATFSHLSEQLAALLEKYSADDAGLILFSGMLISLLWTFFKLMGPFCVPLLLREGWTSLREYGVRFRPFAYALLLYLLVLMIFYIQQRFMNSRYASFLDLLAVPWLLLALMAFVGRFPRLKWALVILACLVMLGNVVSLSAKKTHYRDAGQWLASHGATADTTYSDDPRIGYYAGWGYRVSSLSRDEVMSGKDIQGLRFLALEAKADEPWLVEWLAAHQRKVVDRFANSKGATVVIVGE